MKRPDRLAEQHVGQHRRVDRHKMKRCASQRRPERRDALGPERIGNQRCEQADEQQRGERIGLNRKCPADRRLPEREWQQRDGADRHCGKQKEPVRELRGPVAQQRAIERKARDRDQHDDLAEAD